MGKLLVVYGTTEGQTRKIAREMARILVDAGHEVDLLDPTVSDVDSVMQYDGVLIGASVHWRGYQKALQKWVKKNSLLLNSLPTAFFSVCLGVLERNPDTDRAEREIAQDFFRGSGWNPKEFAIFAGALRYSKYGWLKTKIMQWIAKKQGGGTDPSHDYEYTNWNEVQVFALRFSELVTQAMEEAV